MRFLYRRRIFSFLSASGRSSVGIRFSGNLSMKKIAPLCRSASTFSGRITAPPPREITLPLYADTSLITAVSRSRKYVSPFSLKIVGICPSRSTIRRSVSISSRSSCFATIFPTVDLPEAGIPLNTIFLLSKYISSLILLVSLITSNSCPRNFSAASTACATSIYKPPAASIPRFCADKTNRVCRGL